MAPLLNMRIQLQQYSQNFSAPLRWMTQALATQTTSVELQNWVICALLPWVYWQVQTDKTHLPELKSRYQQAANNAAQALLKYPLKQTLAVAERQLWIDWASGW